MKPNVEHRKTYEKHWKSIGKAWERYRNASPKHKKSIGNKWQTHMKSIRKHNESIRKTLKRGGTASESNGKA